MAGTSTFLALSYIFVVNPAVLAEAGIPKSAVFFATVVASAAATLAMGLWARLPFAVAPGLEMNAYIALVVVGSLGFTWQEALGLCFWSSVLMILVTVSRLRERFLASIPDAMKVSLAAMVGIFVGIIALRLSGIVSYEGSHLASVGLPLDASVAVLAAGLAVVLVLDRLGLGAAALISIIVAAIVAHVLGLSGPAGAMGVSGEMFSGVGSLSLGVLTDPNGLSVILVLFLLDFYGSAAKFIGLTLNTTLMAGGRLPRLKQGLTIDGAGSTLGAALGTSTLTTFVESSVGIRAGGRTGLTAVVCGAWMLAVLPFASAISYIPVVATTGALVFVAISLFPRREQLRRLTATDRVALVAMSAVVVATFALDKAILAGFATYIAAALLAGRRPHPFMVASSLLLVAGIALQHA
jgi:AGZA family xanthine/uracil permease-like MFS transporter